jgi:ketosteroid isomerase-like protein
MSLEDVLAAPDGRVVSLFCHRGKGRGSGVPMELEMAQIATLRDRRITRLDNYSDRGEALEAAGLSE